MFPVQLRKANTAESRYRKARVGRLDAIFDKVDYTEQTHTHSNRTIIARHLPGGTGNPSVAISLRLAPLPPSKFFIDADPILTIT